MEEKHARLLTSNTVHAGRVFRTTRDEVILPNDRPATLDVVRHGASVVLLPMPDPRHIVLVRQYRYVIDQWIWEAPAGSVDSGETPEEAARRECHEEIGRAPGAIERVGALYPSPGFCDELMIFFRCTELSTPDRPASIDADEILHPEIFTLEQARSMVGTAEICDMKTVVGLNLVSR